MPEEDHYLESYLSEILPTLGLDVETYAPYVTGYANGNDDDGGDSLDELIELLRASSDSHGEDENAWEKFRKEIIQRREDYLSGENVRKELQALEIQATTHANLQKEIELAEKNALQMEARKQMELESNKLENMSKDKISLMSKYGYEDDSNTEGAQAAEEPVKPTTNHDVAAAISAQNSQKQKSTKQSKQEARQETKKAKAEKLAKKEVRRKKSGKRERQR